MGRLYERHLTTATGGNISMRIGDSMLITPSGKDKSSLIGDDIIVLDISTGERLYGSLRLSIESEMHRMVYLKNGDAGAVVHSHPTYLCLYSSVDEEVNTSIIAESWYLLGKTVKVPYALMGTKELAERVSDALKVSKAALLEKHGAITTGKSLIEAFDRMEVFEQSAKLTYLSEGHRLNALTESEKLNIERLRS